jgi:hypothetical protein
LNQSGLGLKRWQQSSVFAFVPLQANNEASEAWADDEAPKARTVEAKPAASARLRAFISVGMWFSFQVWRRAVPADCLLMNHRS